MQYTPVIKGPQAQLDCSAYYKVKLDEAFLDYLMDSSVMVEMHMTSHDSDQPQCQSVGQAELKLTEVVHYPSNKLHGSVLVIGHIPLPQIKTFKEVYQYTGLSFISDTGGIVGIFLGFSLGFSTL